MAPNVKPYRDQHAELRRLMSAIPTEPQALHPCEASRALAGLKGVLVVHLSLQDGMLYPWMTRHAAAVVRETAVHHRRTMRTFLTRFLEFYQRWQWADDIAADREGFIVAWRIVQATLLYRLEGEASDLYRVVESYAIDYPAAS